jgi:hypothetical protein
VLLARVLLRTGQPAEARESLRAVLGAGPDPEASWLLSRAALQQGDFPLATEALAAAGTYRAEHPLDHEPAPYVGEARCAGCHPAVTRAAQGSRHAQTFHRGAALADLPLPGRPLPDPDNPRVSHAIARSGDRLAVETRGEGQVLRMLVAYAFGARDRYVTMIGRNEQGEMRRLRVSYYRSAEGEGWDRTFGDAIHPNHPHDVQGMPIDVREGVVRCLFCPRRIPARCKTGKVPSRRTERSAASAATERGETMSRRSRENAPTWRSRPLPSARLRESPGCAPNAIWSIPST